LIDPKRTNGGIAEKTEGTKRTDTRSQNIHLFFMA
jgi:hypothetical protein